MDIKDVLLVLPAARIDRSALTLACRLAREHLAQLHVSCVLSFSPTPAECFALGAAADRDVLERADRQAEAALALAKTTLCDELGEPDLLHDCRRVDEAEAQFAIPSIAQCCDLVILPHDVPPSSGGRALTEQILLRGGSPCLLVPGSDRSGASFAKVVIAWNGSAEAKRAIDASLPLLVAAEEVHIAVVGDPAGLDRHHDEAAVSERLARRGIRCVAHRLGGRARHAADPLLDFCRHVGADLLAMGAYGHGRLNETVFGGTSRGALARAALPILMAN